MYQELIITKKKKINIELNDEKEFELKKTWKQWKNLKC